MMEQQLYLLAEQLGTQLLAKGMLLVTAESCTGGWIAKTVTDVPGSSSWFERGFVTYCNQAKQDMLGVKAQTINQFGAVSEQTAVEMVTGALQHSHADYAVAVTGIAGPAGGSEENPVGTVVLAWQKKGGDVKVIKKHFPGDRQSVRAETVKSALMGCLEMD